MPRSAPSARDRVADLQRAARLRAFVEHVHREARGARRRELIRRVARVDDQAEAPRPARVALGDARLHAVRERRALQRRERARRGRSPASGSLVRSAPSRPRLVFGDTAALRARTRHPESQRFAAACTSAAAWRPATRAQVACRTPAAAEHLRLGEDVRLAAEAADALDAAHEARAMLRSCTRSSSARVGPSRRKRAISSSSALLDCARGRRPASPSRNRRRTARRSRTVDRARADVGRDLVLVHEALVEPRRLAAPRARPRRGRAASTSSLRHPGTFQTL